MRDLLDTLRACALEIGEAVRADQGRGYSGARATQYHLDVVADDIARRVLHGAGLRVVSEESGVSGSGDLTVVVDPVDGSTNCDRGVPFYSTSLAVLREGELVAGLVHHHGTGASYEAEVGAGARRDGVAIAPRTTERLSEAIVAFAGLPGRHAGWSQMRALGAASLEICLVADGGLDAYAMARGAVLNPWDYLAGLLIAREAGAGAADYRGEELVTEASVLRHPVFAATPALLQEMLRTGEL